MPRARRLAMLSLVPLALVATVAPAQSRRDQAAVAALEQRLQSAEAQYRDAVVKARNADPEAQAQADRALEDIEDVIAACAKQRGCSMGTMLAGYKRLLKLNVDAEAATDEVEDIDGGTAALAADVPEAARAAALLSEDGKRFVASVQFNPAVQAGIRRWLTDMRPSLMDSYENYQFMRQQMWPQFERAGLPEALLFGIMAKESNGKVHVSSRAGAAGPLQFMPATGRRFGLGPDGSGFDTRFDPRASAEAAASYLNERLGQLNRNIELSLAAYNGGEGRALRVFNANPSRHFWDESVYNQFPAETRDYVPMVIAAAWLFLHPKEYGLQWPKLDTKPAQIRLAAPSSIYELTICLGNAGTRDGYMRALRNLNPRYQADTFLAPGTVLNATAKMAGLYARHCTQGPRAELARQLVESDPTRAIVRAGPLLPVAPAPADGETGGGAPAETKPVAQPAPSAKVRQRRHTVRRGDTLTAIARRFQCSAGDLARANDLKAPRYALRPGQTLKLDICEG